MYPGVRNMFALVCLVLTADMETGCAQVCSPNRDPSIPVFGVDGRVVTAMCPPRNEAQNATQPVLQGQLADAAPRGTEQRSHFTVSVEGGLYPVIHGTTDVPDGRQLFVNIKKPWLPDAQQRVAQGLPACGDDCSPATTGSNYLSGTIVAVRSGAFVAGPFSFRGQPFRPGAYPLEISLSADPKTATIEQIHAMGTILFETTIQVSSAQPEATTRLPAGTRDASPAAKAFGDCLLFEGGKGSYATTGQQFDGGRSVFRLMAQCKPQWDAWMDQCEADQGVKGGCSEKSYLIAYGALKILGK